MSGFNIKRNAFFSVLGFSVALAAQLVIFRLSEARIGLSGIGFFALIQGLMLFARAFETGVGQNITRRIALTSTGTERWQLIYAGLILILGPTLILSMVSYWAIGIYIDWSNPEIDTTLSRSLLMISFCIALTSASNAVFAAALDGVGMMISRNLAMALAFLLATAVSVPLLSQYGTVGYGAIFLVASGAQLLMSTALLLWNFSAGMGTTLSLVRQSMLSMWVENLAMNGSGLTRLIFEPLSRVWLTEFAGLSAVGLFDILSRLILAARALIQSAINPLLYVGARDQDALSPQQASMFNRVHRLICSIAAHFTLFTFFAAPTVSVFLLGELNLEAVRILSILGLSAGLNLLGVVGYYVALSGGKVGPILRIHIIMLALNFCLGPLLGWMFGSIGVVSAYGIMMAVGGMLSFRLMQQVNAQEPWFSFCGGWTAKTVVLIIISFIGLEYLVTGYSDYRGFIIVSTALVSVGVAGSSVRVMVQSLRSRKLNNVDTKD